MPKEERPVFQVGDKAIIVIEVREPGQVFDVTFVRLEGSRAYLPVRTSSLRPMALSEMVM